MQRISNTIWLYGNFEIVGDGDRGNVVANIFLLSDSDDRFIGSCEMRPKGSMLRKDSSAFGLMFQSLRQEFW